jgi:hypothetical protein
LRDGPAVAAIHLVAGLLRRSSSQPGPLGAKLPYPPLLMGARPLFGLAPGGVCHAVAVASPPVRSYRTLSPLPVRPFGQPSAVCSLWHFPLPPLRRAGGRYPPPLFRGARTFLAHKHAAASGPLTGGPIGAHGPESYFLFIASLVLKTGTHFSARCFTASSPDRGRAAIATESRRSRRRARPRCVRAASAVQTPRPPWSGR